MSENSLIQTPQEDVLETQAQKALQKTLLSPPRPVTSDRINERVLAHLATGYELDSWTVQLKRRLKWMAIPFALSFTLCTFGIQAYQARYEAALLQWKQASEAHRLAKEEILKTPLPPVATSSPKLSDAPKTDVRRDKR